MTPSLIHRGFFAGLLLAGLLAGEARADRAFAVDSGGSTSCAIVDNGMVMCWGNNDHGQLGALLQPGNAAFASSPEQVLDDQGDPLRNVIDIAVGEIEQPFISGYGNHVCAVTAAGRVWCWGRNNHLQLGNSVGLYSTVANQVMLDDGVPLTNITQVSAGGAHTCALERSGHVWCWGRNHGGQLGRGDVGSSTPFPARVRVAADGDLDGVVQIGLGEAFGCARSGDGRVHCWGSDAHHQLGDGSSGGTATSRVPWATLVHEGHLLQASDLAVGTRHACVANTVGNVLCWGQNQRGQGGTGTFAATIDRPTLVKQGAGQNDLTDVIAVAAGSSHSCAQVDAAGAPGVYCWGWNGHGQIGPHPDEGSALAVPVLEQETPPVPLQVTRLSAGAQHTCAVDLNQAVRCWGRNQLGQLGRGMVFDPAVGDPLPDPQTSIVLGIDGSVRDEIFFNNFGSIL